VKLIVASYNTHSAVGIDRRREPQRIADVIEETGADIVALQELTFTNGQPSMLDELQHRSGFHAIPGITFRLPNGAFGNGLLSRFPIRASALIDLSVTGREPRNAISAYVDVGAHKLRFIATHLGLRADERLRQAETLIANLDASEPTIVAGDINEWRFPKRALNRLNACLRPTSAHATFPAPLPIFALDRLWTSSNIDVVRVWAHGSRRARMASDHRPLVAELQFG
jgi:endonuclease/exonuclease/phosphatase family metal-dependent hydrolase